MGDILEQLTQEWIAATETYNKDKNAFTRSKMDEARAQVQAAAEISIAQNLQKMELHLSQNMEGAEWLHVMRYTTQDI